MTNVPAIKCGLQTVNGSSDITGNYNFLKM